jgi:SRSO17 transposase
MMDYCAGLVTVARRNVEIMVVETKPSHLRAQHQRLLHIVAISKWSDEQVLAKVSQLVVPTMTRRGPIEAWIIDDTSFPKQGQHSAGGTSVCGQLGKQANCCRWR